MKYLCLLFASLSCLLFASLPSAPAQQTEIPIQVPKGFVIERFADDDLATNIYSLTINSNGEVVVSGPGYIKVLLDENKDGKADKVRKFSDLPKQGAQGLFFEGNDLYATGDGGLLKFKDADGNGVADGPPEKILPLKTGGEHDAHAIRRGPDGWLYVLCGNGVPIRKEYFDGKYSPVKKPRAGFLMRISPDWSKREIVCHGFRNAYDFAFDVEGGIHIYDSDGERDVSMPWYRPTRVFRIKNGDDAGFVSPSWKRPHYFPNMPLVTARLGRGSPTGVVCYRHKQFPKSYFNSVFALDWTFGRIVAIKPLADGTYKSEPLAVGKEQFGFAPTDAEVAPDGSLYVSVGGRGTRGGVFRIRYADAGKQERKVDDLVIQPLASWARKKNQSTIDQMKLNDVLEKFQDDEVDVRLRHRLSEIISDHFRDQLSLGMLIEQISDQKNPALARRLLRPLVEFIEERSFADGCIKILASKKTWDFFVGLQIELRGTDAMNRMGQSSKIGSTLSGLKRTVVTGDEKKKQLHYRQIRRLVELLPFKSKPSRPVFSSYESELPDSEKKRINIIRPQVSKYLEQNLKQLSSLDSEIKLEVLRVAAMAQCLSIDPELSRLAVKKSVAEITADSNPIHDIHILACLAVIGEKLDESQRKSVTDGIVNLVNKIQKQKLNRDRNWPRHMKDIVSQLIKNDAELATSVTKHPDFAKPHNEYLYFVANRLKDKSEKQSIRNKVATFVKNNLDDPNINGKVLAFIDQQIRSDSKLLNQLWERKELRPRLLQSITVRANALQKEKYIAGLQMADPQTTRRSALALMELGLDENPVVVTNAVRVLVRMGWDRQEQTIREQMVALLRQQTQKRFGFQMGDRGRNPQSEAIAKWINYAKTNHAKEFASVFQNSNIAAWTSQMLEKTDWSKGDITRGKKLYQSLSCAQCHDGARALGPRLQGITRRFNREDLFKSMTQPDEQVSSRYRTIVIETTAGEVVKGVVIYESVDGLTLVDRQNQTVRIEASEIDHRQASTTSLMPSGLLDKTKPEDWADLYAYLKTLK